ncbi:hypothetical protein F0267_25835 [Vibrio coralliilyticus]|uniref:hypothetical protein n=1 Tax=Vibrio TaxID=662 RepID=UPI00148D5BE3|nr:MULTISPECIES: hypothetical protein [Vibrio]NOH26191.1 hypothetical protein [Vibrio europaeus]NOH41650.1 hypothetical protein [Vibrio coralliilyticus]
MFQKYKALLLIGAIAGLAYLSYDYGHTSAVEQYQAEKIELQAAKDKLLDKLADKNDEAYLLAFRLATQSEKVRTEVKEIEKEVIKYVQENPDNQCVVNDGEWLRIRAAALRAYNRAVSVHEPTAALDDAPD